jgi:predicted transcriptional regulator
MRFDKARSAAVTFQGIPFTYGLRNSERSRTASAFRWGWRPDQPITLPGAGHIGSRKSHQWLDSTVSLHFRLRPELARDLAQHARSRRVSQAAFVEAALSSFLSPDGTDRLEAAISRRLDRLGRQFDRFNQTVTFCPRGRIASKFAITIHQSNLTKSLKIS